MSAPASNSNSVQSVWPAATAHRKGVMPFASLGSTDARFLKRILTHSGLPNDAALIKGEIIMVYINERLRPNETGNIFVQLAA